MPVSERNLAKNLVLLCLECHKIIDDKITRGDYSEDELLHIKREHESRMFHLTGIPKDMDTTVIRVFGGVRGSMTELAREIALQTTYLGAGRYAKFPLAADPYDGIELDLTKLPDPETVGGAYWEIGKTMIDTVAGRIADAVHNRHVRHLSVFALARIPLLVYLGYKLDDKVPVDLYQKHRGEDEGWIWPKVKEAAVAFETNVLREGKGDQVALILSLSGTIGLSELPEAAAGMTVYEIKPQGITPNPSLFKTKETLDAFSRAYRDFLAELERGTKPTRIHLFSAAPITAAIACGRNVMRDVHPTIEVYDRQIGGHFQTALTINER